MQTDVTISLAQLLWLIGGVMAIGGFFKWVLTPFKKIDDHETRISSLEKSAEKQKEVDTYITKALNAIVNHMIDGNGIKELKEVRDEFQNKIIGG